MRIKSYLVVFILKQLHLPVYQYLAVTKCPNPRLPCVCSAILGAPVVPLVKYKVMGSSDLELIVYKTPTDGVFLLITKLCYVTVKHYII